MAKKKKLEVVAGTDMEVITERPEGGWYGEDWRVATGQEHLSDHWAHGDPYQPDMRPKKPEE